MSKDDQKIREYYSIPEYAKIMNISRIAVYKQVKKKFINAKKIGRNYAIPASYVTGKELTNEQKHVVDTVVDKTIKEYGNTLKMLGNE